MKINKFAFMVLVLALMSSPTYASSVCMNNKVKLQVLGSGGPELSDQRASSSYLIWVNDKARVLIDTGTGSSLNFEKSMAKFEDLEAIVFSHFHVDHSGDFPALLKGSYFTPRNKNLPVYGPAGNDVMPSTTEFIKKTIGRKGAFSYLEDFIIPKDFSRFRVQPYDVPLTSHKIQPYPLTSDLTLSAIPVHHEKLAAIAWRIDVFDCSITFSGDMNNAYKTLEKLAKDTDILVMHNAVPESAGGLAAELHMKPSEIGIIANKAKAKSVVISHRMSRTLGKERQNTERIKQGYDGPIKFADDLDVFSIP